MICSLHRRHINNALDSGREVSALTRRHFESCVSCRQFHDEQSRIAQVMRETGYHGEPIEMPPYLATRIRAHLQATGNKSQPFAIHRRFPRLSISAAVLAVLLAITGITFHSPSVKTQPARTALPASPKPSNPELKPVAVGPTIGRLASNPLESEMHLLAADTESALRYLTATFVPSGSDETTRL